MTRRWFTWRFIWSREPVVTSDRSALFPRPSCCWDCPEIDDNNDDDSNSMRTGVDYNELLFQLVDHRWTICLLGYGWPIGRSAPVEAMHSTRYVAASVCGSSHRQTGVGWGGYRVIGHPNDNVKQLVEVRYRRGERGTTLFVLGCWSAGHARKCSRLREWSNHGLTDARSARLNSWTFDALNVDVIIIISPNDDRLSVTCCYAYAMLSALTTMRVRL